MKNGNNIFDDWVRRAVCVCLVAVPFLVRAWLIDPPTGYDQNPITIRIVSPFSKTNGFNDDTVVSNILYSHDLTTNLYSRFTSTPYSIFLGNDYGLTDVNPSEVVADDRYSSIYDPVYNPFGEYFMWNTHPFLFSGTQQVLPPLELLHFYTTGGYSPRNDILPVQLLFLAQNHYPYEYVWSVTLVFLPCFISFLTWPDSFEYPYDPTEISFSVTPLEWQLNQQVQTGFGLYTQQYDVISDGDETSNILVEADSVSLLELDFPLTVEPQYMSPLEIDFSYIFNWDPNQTVFQHKLYPNQGDYVIFNSYLSIIYSDGTTLKEIAFPEIHIPYKFNDQLFP
jgi:hypothetical protein